jgi:putative heme iron utilization protein
VPYAPRADGDVVVVISTLAEHTQNVARDPRVTLLVADSSAVKSPWTAPRASVMARAARLVDAAREEALAAYLARFPSSRAIASMPDFAPWRLHVERVRWIGGFAAAAWIGRERWAGASG